MIKNQQEIIALLQPQDPIHFFKWLSNKIESILKLKDIPTVLPYDLNSAYGSLRISSASEITINDCAVLYDF